MQSISHRSYRGRRAINEINMVPFIDVMLVLLIIFMVTAPMIAPSMIQLPSVGQANKRPDKVIQVIVQKDGQISVKSDANSIVVPLSELASSVSNYEGSVSDNEKQATVVISADKRIEYEKVVEVMNTLQKAGIQRLGLSVQLTH
jgi:biopolymer transport protein TolR